MLKNQTVNHVSEHLSAICPVYTPTKGGLKNSFRRPGSGSEPGKTLALKHIFLLTKSFSVRVRPCSGEGPRHPFLFLSP